MIPSTCLELMRKTRNISAKMVDPDHNLNCVNFGYKEGIVSTTSHCQRVG